MNEFLKDLLPNFKKMRDETAAMCCEDMVLSDGTVIWTKEQGLESVMNYDKLIETITRQVGTAEADPQCP